MLALLAQWIERLSTEQKVGSSSLSRSTLYTKLVMVYTTNGDEVVNDNAPLARPLGGDELPNLVLLGSIPSRAAKEQYNLIK